MPSLHHTVHSFRMARLRDRTRASALLKGRNADVCAGCRYLGTSGPPRQPGSTTALEPLPRYRALSFIWPPPLLAALEELATLPARQFQPPPGLPAMLRIALICLAAVAVRRATGHGSLVTPRPRQSIDYLAGVDTQWYGTCRRHWLLGGRPSSFGCPVAAAPPSRLCALPFSGGASRVLSRGVPPLALILPGTAISSGDAFVACFPVLFWPASPRADHDPGDVACRHLQVCQHHGRQGWSHLLARLALCPCQPVALLYTCSSRLNPAR